jgi:hypothetical protein
MCCLLQTFIRYFVTKYYYLCKITLCFYTKICFMYKIKTYSDVRLGPLLCTCVYLLLHNSSH